MKRLISILLTALFLVACGAHDEDYPDVEGCDFVAHNGIEASPTPEDISLGESPAYYAAPADYVIYADDEPQYIPELEPKSEPEPANDILYAAAEPQHIPRHEPQMSEFGRQVAMDFLMQFPTIFMENPRHIAWSRPYEVANTRLYFPIPQQYGREMQDGRFRVRSGDDGYIYDRLFHIGYQFGDTYTVGAGRSMRTNVRREPILTEYVPDVFFREFWSDFWRGYDYRRMSGFYDSNLNRIESADWMIYNVHYATDFRLWDFNQNGIPAIEIEYRGGWTGYWGESISSIFIFDGYEYRRIAVPREEYTGSFTWDMYDWVFVYPNWINQVVVYHAFHDPDGRLIFVRGSGVSFEGYPFKYYHVTFSDGFSNFYHFASVYGDVDSAWWHYEYDFLPGTDIPLTPTLTLIELQAELYEAIRQQLGLCRNEQTIQSTPRLPTAEAEPFHNMETPSRNSIR